MGSEDGDGSSQQGLKFPLPFLSVTIILRQTLCYSSSLFLLLQSSCLLECIKSPSLRQGSRDGSATNFCSPASSMPWFSPQLILPMLRPLSAEARRVSLERFSFALWLYQEFLLFGSKRGGLGTNPPRQQEGAWRSVRAAGGSPGFPTQG